MVTQLGRSRLARRQPLTERAGIAHALEKAVDRQAALVAVAPLARQLPVRFVVRAAFAQRHEIIKARRWQGEILAAECAGRIDRQPVSLPLATTQPHVDNVGRLPNKPKQRAKGLRLDVVVNATALRELIQSAVKSEIGDALKALREEAKKEATSEGLMSIDELSKYLGLARGTISGWICTGDRKLPHIKVGGRVRFREQDIDVWLDHASHNLVEQIGDTPYTGPLRNAKVQS
jgi:excisionase family DNA binding protein